MKLLNEQDLLNGNVDDVAAWVVRALGGRYAITRPPDQRESIWWRFDGRRWRRVHPVVPAQAIRYELEHAYHQLLPDDRYSCRRIERLLNPRWVEASLMPAVRRILTAP